MGGERNSPQCLKRSILVSSIEFGYLKLQNGLSESTFCIELCFKGSSIPAWDTSSFAKHRIIESFRLEKTSKIPKLNHNHPTVPTAHGPQCHIPMALGHPQGR